MSKVFIVEDDRVIASEIKKQLELWGMEADCAHDFKNVAVEFASFAPQIVLLDISLPFFDGYHWCREIRRVSSVPIIFISSVSDNMNIVMAINMGADDFISKPFDIGVLTAKVQALLRRTYEFGAQSGLIEYRGAVLNTGDATLSAGGNRIDLTKNEYRIILTLLEKRGQIVSRETLMEKLWETDSFVDENTLTVNVNRLRKKLDAAGLSDLIGTKKGVGYMVE